MVPFLFLLSILILSSAGYLIERRNKNNFEKNNFVSLTKLQQMLPKDAFLHPSLTWSKILDTGDVAIGVQPILMVLIGEADNIEISSEENSIKKGEPLITIRKGEKEIKVKSPVSGKILEKNIPVLEESNWKYVSKNWLFSVKPENISTEMENWYFAEKSKEWISKTFQQIKYFLSQAIQHKQIGLTLADGGDIPVGILSLFDDKSWTSFENTFIE